MTLLPETKTGLIVRLHSPSDEAAWREFVEVYEPFIYRFGRRCGLQDADASDLVQRVMWSVAKAVQRSDPGRIRGRFRGWLFQIARNELINLIKQVQREQGWGGTTEIAVLSEAIVTPCTQHDADCDYRREVFRYAAARVREVVHDSTWQAFWLSAVEAIPITAVAQQLSMTKGAVYIARSRVIARLREVVQQLEANDALQ